MTTLLQKSLTTMTGSDTFRLFALTPSHFLLNRFLSFLVAYDAREAVMQKKILSEKKIAKKFGISGDSGAAALEYLIVSTCAAALALGSLAYVAKLYKSRFDHLSERFNLEESEVDDMPDDPLSW